MVDMRLWTRYSTVLAQPPCNLVISLDKNESAKVLLPMLSPLGCATARLMEIIRFSTWSVVNFVTHPERKLWRSSADV